MTVLSFSAHLRGGLGYYDEDTGSLVETYKKTETQADSPALDKGEIGATYARERKPHGCRLNMGCYGNTPYATMSSSGFYLRFR